MKKETPKAASDRKQDEAVDPSGSVDEETGAAKEERDPNKPRLASIVREVEAAVRELEEPPTKE